MARRLRFIHGIGSPQHCIHREPEVDLPRISRMPIRRRDHAHHAPARRADSRGSVRAAPVERAGHEAARYHVPASSARSFRLVIPLGRAQPPAIDDRQGDDVETPFMGRRTAPAKASMRKPKEGRRCPEPAERRGLPKRHRHALRRLRPVGAAHINHCEYRRGFRGRHRRGDRPIY